MKSILKQVASGQIKWSCFECADKHKNKEPYEGTLTCHQGICEICKQSAIVSSAKKLFGQHKFI